MSLCVCEPSFFHAIHYSCLILQRVVITRIRYGGQWNLIGSCRNAFFNSDILYIYQIAPRNQINAISKNWPEVNYSRQQTVHTVDCYHLVLANSSFTYPMCDSFVRTKRRWQKKMYLSVMEAMRRSDNLFLPFLTVLLPHS